MIGALLAGLALAATPEPAAAPRVTVVAATPQAEGLARRLAGIAPDLVGRAARRLDLPAPRNVVVVVAAEAPRTAEAAHALDLFAVPVWSAGIADPARGRIVLFADRLALAGHAGVEGALAHEAAHIVFGAAMPRAARAPRWFEEGLAMVVEREFSLRDFWELTLMAAFDGPRPLSSLEWTFPDDAPGARAAYAEALSFVAFAERSAPPGAPRRLIAALESGLDFEHAFAVAYGQSPSVLEARWRESLSRRYITPLLAVGFAVGNVAFGVLALIAVLAARRRRRRRLAEWEAEEAGEPAGSPPPLS